MSIEVESKSRLVKIGSFFIAFLIALLLNQNPYKSETINESDNIYSIQKETAIVLGEIFVDTNKKDEGYILVKNENANEETERILVKKDDKSLVYTIPGLDETELIPLQMGSGQYKLGVYKFVHDNKYELIGETVINADIADETTVFLEPNQYVDFSNESSFAETAWSLKGDTDKETVRNIYKYITKCYAYDLTKASKMKESGFSLPEIERCYETKLGICQDIAALMCAMIRLNNIPAKFVIGYADRNYHAWVSVIEGDKEILFDPTSKICKTELSEYTVERVY